MSDADHGDVERALARLRAFKMMVDRGPAVVFLWRVQEGWPVDFVTENVSQFGYTPEEFTSGEVSWPGITYPDDVPRLEAGIRGYFESGIDEFAQEEGRSAFVPTETAGSMKPESLYDQAEYFSARCRSLSSFLRGGDRFR